MDSKMIEKLEAKGFERWTKGNYDRLYVDAEAIGLECEYYNSGNICYAELDGEKISNSLARKLKMAKTFIDVKTGEIYSDSETLKEKIEEIIEQLNEDEEDKEEEMDTVIERMPLNYNDFGQYALTAEGMEKFDELISKRIPDGISWCGDELIGDVNLDITIDINSIIAEVSEEMMSEYGDKPYFEVEE